VFTSILAIGMVMVIITGHIDLSAGSLAGLTGGIVSILHVWRGWNPYPSIAVTLIVGLALGLWNGYWVAYKKVPAFIVTLGGLLVFRGALVGITKGTTIGPMGELFRYIGKGYLPEYGGIILAVVGSAYFLYVQYRTRKGRLKYDFEVLPIHLEILKSVAALTLIAVFVLVMNSYQGVPVPLIGLLVLFFIFSFVTKNTVFGRHIYAIGGNSEAAQMSGINVARTTLLVFVLNGLMAAIGGILMTARLNAASVAAGQNAELDAIAACVIGGTSLMGGIGSVGGAVIGAVVMASLDNGMSLLNVPMFWQSIVKGLVLVLAVWFDVSSTKK
jgi:D-xylose transport system permease protein